jgi:hypothetical protein
MRRTAHLLRRWQTFNGRKNARTGLEYSGSGVLFSHVTICGVVPTEQLRRLPSGVLPTAIETIEYCAREIFPERSSRCQASNDLKHRTKTTSDFHIFPVNSQTLFSLRPPVPLQVLYTHESGIVGWLPHELTVMRRATAL